MHVNSKMFCCVKNSEYYESTKKNETSKDNRNRPTI